MTRKIYDCPVRRQAMRSGYIRREEWGLARWELVQERADKATGRRRFDIAIARLAATFRLIKPRRASQKSPKSLK